MSPSGKLDEKAALKQAARKIGLSKSAAYREHRERQVISDTRSHRIDHLQNCVRWSARRSIVVATRKCRINCNETLSPLSFK